MRPPGAAWYRCGGMLGMLAAVLAVAVVLCSGGARAPAELLRQINEDTKSLQSTNGVVPRPAETVEQFYASQHPVYTRCAKAVDMPAFTEFVAQTCGNIHEVSGCAEPCAQALQAKSSEFGCCWETVMQAYAQIDASAELAWRSWQGALSGKCGISFKDEACGDSMGLDLSSLAHPLFSHRPPCACSHPPSPLCLRPTLLRTRVSIEHRLGKHVRGLGHRHTWRVCTWHVRTHARTRAHTHVSITHAQACAHMHTHVLL